MVESGRTDLEISSALSLHVKCIYEVRKFVLKMNNWGRKRVCPKCKQPRVINLFKLTNREREEDYWCIICRRKAGVQEQYHVKNGKKKREAFGYGTKTLLCLRCELSFESVILSKDGREFYHLCDHCRAFVDAQDRISI